MDEVVLSSLKDSINVSGNNQKINLQDYKENLEEPKIAEKKVVSVVITDCLLSHAFFTLEGARSNG